MNENLYLIWLLLVNGAAKSINKRLLDVFKSFEGIYKAQKFELQNAGVLPKNLERFSNKNLTEAEKILEYIETRKIQILKITDDIFPESLKYISPPPVAIFVKGNLPNFKTNIPIGVVGTRKCTSYGSDVAFTISRDLARYGCIVVSGMALGIDAEASKGALSIGGETVVVLGGGVDNIYPPQNKELYYEICKNGTIISEYLPTKTPTKISFPERNRIISGLSRGVLIVESGESGGSLITANYTLDQGKDLFVVPGPIGSDKSIGTINLLNRGAKAVSGYIDILEEYISIEKIKNLSTKKQTQQKETKPKTGNEIWDKILSVMSHEAVPLSDIAYLSNLPAEKVASEILMLELDGKVIAQKGARYKLNKM